MSEEFPSFKKTKAPAKEKNSYLSLLALFGLLLLVSLAIVSTFRFLIGSKTPRDEMLATLYSASPNRQSSLLMEWLQNLEQDPARWKPTALEQSELLAFSSARLSALKAQEKGPALFSLHVASQGPGGMSHTDETLSSLRSAGLTGEPLLALALYHLRQRDFGSDALSFMKPMSASTHDAERKIASAYFAQCVVGADAANNAFCLDLLTQLLADSVDEVRWNASLGLFPEGGAVTGLPSQILEQARGEIGKLFVLIRNEDTTLLSRFNSTALETLAREVFRILYQLSPAEFVKELRQVSSSHSDLRIRNLARSFESKN